LLLERPARLVPVQGVFPLRVDGHRRQVVVVAAVEEVAPQGGKLLLESGADAPELVGVLAVLGALVLLSLERVSEAGVLEDQLGGATTGRMRGGPAEPGKGRDAFLPQDRPMMRGSVRMGAAFYYLHAETRGLWPEHLDCVVFFF